VHRDAPKSAALNYAAGQQPPADSANAASGSVATAAATSRQPSLLAQKFGAEAIRDGDDTHTQIRFASKPEAELRFLSADGKSLHPKWDGSVVTIDRVD